MNKIRSTLQKSGRFMSAMVMPNIGAFIAWGLITALFIPNGWFPNATLSKLVEPMIIYMLPVLIGYTGGKIVFGSRGGVIGAIATMGVIVGASVPMFIGAMIVGPLGGYAIKKVDHFLQQKTPIGFEMLVNNFSAGIVGVLLALGGLVVIGPLIEGMNSLFRNGGQLLIDANLLPLVSFVIEPAKIMFLNNAINHGILGPLGIQEAAQYGKSIFFLLETNPGPGLGVLLAFMIFGKGLSKQSSPGAIVIHFFGGIHEIYFPYVLMKPKLIIAVIAGGFTGVLTFSLFNVGLVATPSPGSIFALIAMAPRGNFLGLILGIFSSTAVSFIISSIFIAKDKEDPLELLKAKELLFTLKGKRLNAIKTIAFACDAGMGSSAMGASMLTNKMKKAKLNIRVFHCSLEEIPSDIEIVVTHKDLQLRASKRVPNAIIIPINNFVEAPEYDLLIERIQQDKVKNQITEKEDELMFNKKPVLNKKNILLGLPSCTRDEAIKKAGSILIEDGYVEPPYLDAMYERETIVSTFVGNGAAIPHGVGSARNYIKHSGLVILQYPQGIDYNGQKTYLVIGLSGKDNDHIKILSNIASSLSDESIAKALAESTDINFVYKTFVKGS